MKHKNLYLVRGVSGSGKTSLAKAMYSAMDDAAEVCADYFMLDDEGNYFFDPKKLQECHSSCLSTTDTWLESGVTNVIVHNTFTDEWQLQPYLDLAEKYGYRVFSIVNEKRHECANVHNVPEETLKSQDERIRKSLKLS